MEATAQGTQREITLASLALVKARRPQVHVFNELLVQYPVRGRRKPQQGDLARQWVRKVQVEAFLLAGVLLCTALLVHRVPARHASHTRHLLAEKQAHAGSIRISMQALHAHGGVPPGWRFRLPQGDPARGRQVFLAVGCHACHAVRGEAFSQGSRELGPELTGMGAHHPDTYLLESILNPNAVIVEGPGYTTPDGRSLMPEYRDLLTVGQLIDLVAFLKSLREEQH